MDVVELVSKVAGLDPEKLRITPIAAGLPNQNSRLDVGEQTFFFRRPGAATELLAVDRENELFNTRAAAEAGYADQSHLTRECAELAGLPPAALLAARGTASAARV